MMFHRHIKPSKCKSFFLFGARGTGKTTLLRSRFPDADLCCFSKDSRPKRFGRILCLPWQKGVERVIEGNDFVDFANFDGDA